MHFHLENKRSRLKATTITNSHQLIARNHNYENAKTESLIVAKIGELCWKYIFSRIYVSGKLIRPKLDEILIWSGSTSQSDNNITFASPGKKSLQKFLLQSNIIKVQTENSIIFASP